MDCPNTAQVHAYHDGELAPSEIATIEAHLVKCAECRELLADLRRVSQLIALAPMADMPADAMRRLQQSWWAAQERGVRRIASWLTAAAAAVMLATTLWSSSGDRPDNATPPTQVAWQVEALTPPTDTQDEPQNETITAAQYIANDLAVAMR